MLNCVCIPTKIPATVCIHLSMCMTTGFSLSKVMCLHVAACFSDGPMAPLQGQVGVSLFGVYSVFFLDSPFSFFGFFIVAARA